MPPLPEHYMNFGIVISLCLTAIILVYLAKQGTRIEVEKLRTENDGLRKEVDKLQKRATRYYNLKKQTEDEKELPGEDDFKELSEALGVEVPQEILDTVQEIGIPKGAIKWAMKNPEFVKKYLSQYLGKGEQGGTEDNPDGAGGWN